MDLTKPQFVALTAEGGHLAARLAKCFGGDWHGLAIRMDGLVPDAAFDDAASHIRDLYLSRRPVIGICSAAILIRAVSGHLHDKQAEPPLIAMSEDGQAIVPLLGGHYGGHDLAVQLARETRGVMASAVTTAGDRRFGVALDAPPSPFVLADRHAAKPVMAAALAGKTFRLMDDLGDDLSALAARWHHWLAPLNAVEDGALRLMLTLKPASDVDADLVYHPSILTLGLGASRDCPRDEMAALIDRGFAESGLAQAAIRGIYSLDLKADEAAILEAAAVRRLRLHVFTAPRLDEETPRLTEPSDVVYAEIGCHGVAEAAALAAVGAEGQLIKPKIKDSHATMAIALDPSGAFAPSDCRHSGQVMLVGIGPGQSAWRTPEATAMIAAADELVGYGLYIDLLGAAAAGKPRRDFALGEEEARCRFALEEAAKGKDIAMICSGDAGIYAMAALVFELLQRDADRGGVSDAARRVAVSTAPGVSALQAAAARSGAILGHDFCTISLSDLLTPWPAIEKRIDSAGRGDFVVAFYNPVSRRRRSHLATARDILLKYRPPSTPVVLASSLGRPEEDIKHRDLGTLDINEVDMLTVVMVGASSSQRIKHSGSGHAQGQVVFTPRGYAKKIDKAEQEK
jgi:cobalt-precorrin 5A hydrolase/precorrin-3B C17-methyltransferase